MQQDVHVIQSLISVLSYPLLDSLFRDGSEVSRDRSGNVLAEIILQKSDGGRMAALASYSSPWPLGKF